MADGIGTVSTVPVGISRLLTGGHRMTKVSKWLYRTYLPCFLALLIIAGCSGDTNNTTTTTTIVQQSLSNQRAPLSPLRLQQFGNPLVEIPIAPQDTSNPNV